METMTVKEVAEIAGVTGETVKNTIRDIYPDLMVNGVQTNLNHEQAVKVMSNVRSKNTVLDEDGNPMQPTKPTNKDLQVESQNATVATEVDSAAMTAALQFAYEKGLQAQTQTQIALPRRDFQAEFRVIHDRLFRENKFNYTTFKAASKNIYLNVSYFLKVYCHIDIELRRNNEITKGVKRPRPNYYGEYQLWEEALDYVQGLESGEFEYRKIYKEEEVYSSI